MLNLLMIQNIGGRLNNFEPLLNFIVSQGLGKKEKNLYIINSNVMSSEGSSIESMTINLIHRHATIKGFSNIIYDLNEVL